MRPHFSQELAARPFSPQNSIPPDEPITMYSSAPLSMEGSGRRCYHAEREPRLPLKTLHLPAQESKPLSGS